MRLFLAINLPESVRQALWEAAGPLRAASFPIRWVAPESIHLTLRFLGEVAPQRQAEIVTAAEQAAEGAKPFTLGIEGFGAFPTVERPRVVWAGCEAAPALELLQHRVEQAMEGVGFPIEGRPFHPHLTLGRVQRNAKRSALRDFAAALEPLAYSADVTATSLDLMQSTLSREGARYTVVHAVAFAP
jgi:2'-5' RNA ligase